MAEVNIFNVKELAAAVTSLPMLLLGVQLTVLPLKPGLLYEHFI
jgi:hypothetical protein